MQQNLNIIHAIILRSSIARGGLLIAPSFTDIYGRISLATYKNSNNLLTPFSLVEVELARLDGDFGMAKQFSVLDTFTEARESKDGAKALMHLRMILEHSLPQGAPSKPVWEVLNSLLSCLSSFSDWKTSPFLLALLFFEQEGVSKETLLLSKISETSKEKAVQLFAKEDWEHAEIPEDLYQATLECIRIDQKNAKGGT